MKDLNVRVLLANSVKSGRWVSYTFLQKRCSFKSFSILEENCAADIINETFNCKTFVGKCCKKEPLSKLYLPTKALFLNAVKSGSWVSYTFLLKPSLFNLFWIRASFWRNFFVCKINDFGEINIWRSWWRRNVMRKKIHLLIK